MCTRKHMISPPPDEGEERLAADQRERYARQVDGEDDVSDARYGGDGAGTGKRGDVRDVRYVENGAGDAKADDARAQGEKCTDNIGDA